MNRLTGGHTGFQNVAKAGPLQTNRSLAIELWNSNAHSVNIFLDPSSVLSLSVNWRGDAVWMGRWCGELTISQSDTEEIVMRRVSYCPGSSSINQDITNVSPWWQGGKSWVCGTTMYQRTSNVTHETRPGSGVHDLWPSINQEEDHIVGSDDSEPTTVSLWKQCVMSYRVRGQMQTNKPVAIGQAAKHVLFLSPARMVSNSYSAVCFIGARLWHWLSLPDQHAVFIVTLGTSPFLSIITLKLEILCRFGVHCQFHACVHRGYFLFGKVKEEGMLCRESKTEKNLPFRCTFTSTN